MKKQGIQNLLILILSIFPLLSANAQTQSSSTPPQSTKPTSSFDVFPKLPESSLCTKEKLVGTWKLLMVYEVPSGREIELYTGNPLQYYVFEPDTRYGEYVSILSAVTLKTVKEVAIDKQKTPQQFLINKDGLIFFYKAALAVDSLACFIVEKTSPPFRVGQLLLMPPEKAAKGRMLKVYQKMFPEMEMPPTVIFKPSETNVE